MPPQDADPPGDSPRGNPSIRYRFEKDGVCIQLRHYPSGHITVCEFHGESLYKESRFRSLLDAESCFEREKLTLGRALRRDRKKMNMNEPAEDIEIRGEGYKTMAEAWLGLKATPKPLNKAGIEIRPTGPITRELSRQAVKDHENQQRKLLAKGQHRKKRRR